MILSAAFLLVTIPALGWARTDLVGCTATTNGPVVTWYVPGTGELCDFLDCGGGTAPPKTTVPGCPLYSGTASYSPSYLPGWGPNGQSPVASSSSAASTTMTGAANSATTGADSMTTPAATLGLNSTAHGSSTATAATQSQNVGSGIGGALAAIGGAVVGVVAML